MNEPFFDNFLRIQEVYKLKTIPRDSSNHYHDEKDNVFYKRRETTSEHGNSSQRLADFFLTTEPEFSNLDRLLVYELILYHDDLEIITRDLGISETEKRKDKEKKEIEALPILYSRYPDKLNDKLIYLTNLFKQKSIPESKFANGIDKMDALVHELSYPSDWGPKGYDETKVRAWFQPAFEYSPTFMKYFESMIKYLDRNEYFKK